MISRDSAVVEQLLGERFPDLTSDQCSAVLAFYGLLVAENAVQNLTRLISPVEFVEGHLEDVIALAKSGLVKFPAMDLGSGCGVPGLLAAAIFKDRWVLVDSEHRKADFLERARTQLGLSEVSVFSGRGEAFLRDGRVSSIVARAVGPVDRIYAWVRSCSTWNNLVLLKGPGWEKEKAVLESGKLKRELRIDGEFAYEVGTERKKRLIVRVSRVPRGTK